MNRVRVVPFNREHLFLMRTRKYEEEHLLPFLTDMFLSVAETSANCYTMLIDDRIITCFGGVPLWEGVYEVWQIPSVYVLQYAKEYCRTIRGVLDKTAKELGLWRVQTISPADELHDRWMKFLGFKCEGTLEKYSRFKIDHRMWAKGYNYGG